MGQNRKKTFRKTRDDSVVGKKARFENNPGSADILYEQNRKTFILPEPTQEKVHPVWTKQEDVHPA